MKKERTHQWKYWEKERKRRAPDHQVVEAFVTPKIEFIQEYVDLKSVKVLDVGCGNGFFTYYFSQLARTVGVDYSTYMLSINPCEPLVHGSALSLPFKDSNFDLVFCSNLLHHLKDPTIAIREMVRVSKKFVILSEPNRNNPLMALFSVISAEERGVLKFSLNYMKELVGLCELKIIASSSMGLIVPNKTPASLLGVLRKVDRKTPIGFYNVIISEK